MVSFRYFFISIILLHILSCTAQKAIDKPVTQSQNAPVVSMNPDLLWQLKRVSAIGITPDGNELIYKVSTPNVDSNRFASQYFKISIHGGEASVLTQAEGKTKDNSISPDEKWKLMDKVVKVIPVEGKDFYPELKQTTAQIYTTLDYRHWDTWNDGTYNHLLYGKADAAPSEYIDIMANEPYNSPQKPFGDQSDYIWSPDSKYILYVSKKKAGTEAAISTNTDIYQYELSTAKTINLTSDNKGYDTNPQYSGNGDLAWLSMKTDGNEADKNDIIVLSNGIKTNLTAHWDETVMSYKWSNDGKSL